MESDILREAALRSVNNNVDQGIQTHYKRQT